ncbi:MAG: RNA polymerase subunit sigma-24 [Bacteroidetes bacterium]|nr:MAG: RNA polymerase subunit sigma-24 [Bacteroidota bacterium]
MTTEAFKLELLPKKDKLFRLAIFLLKNREEAEDTVQEIYLKLWDMKEQLGKYNNLEAVMMTMTRNRCLDKLKTKREKFASLNESINNQPYTSPMEQSIQQDMVKQVKVLMTKLPEQQKTIIHLRDVEGCEYKEIQEITGFDSNYIRVNLSRARKSIRESLIKLEENELR